MPKAEQMVPGIAWDVKGSWRVEGTPAPILTGDVIEPGALLQPAVEDSAHSITVLLPDGQQILYECFTARDCARGFRVPALFRDPDPMATWILERIRAVLVKERSQTGSAPAKDTHIARDETVTVLGPGNRIEIGGLAAALSNGQYTGDLRSLGGRYPEQSGIPLEKTGRTIAMTVPGPGLYQLTIVDVRKWPRIDLLIAAEPSQDSTVARDFQKEQALLAEWKEDYFGWPTHEFQRAYLESLMLDVPPAPSRGRRAEHADPPLPGTTAEPTFAPKAGLIAGNLSIRLECATPGAVIHYTEGGSQPMENSPVYPAPIVVKRIPMTIKAFAEAPGKKDSAVVTGNFRIQGHED